jgi:hypothetical protein
MDRSTVGGCGLEAAGQTDTLLAIKARRQKDDMGDSPFECTTDDAV